ncbi:MAG: hypothetical protein DMG13_11585 [Acidobacteria bacterium]|nr:MAG: hypothetical protein DMG13_11585 [Acidobacteriota bacterium]
MLGVRPFRCDDIPQVADLHRRVMRIGDPTSELLAEYRDYLVDVYLENPWRQGGIEALVYEEQGGRIVAFFGVTPRRISAGGAIFTAAVGSNFCVEPTRRGLVGIKVLDEFLRGPQDLSLADEANNISRQLWERLGGSTALLYSMRWSLPLRPMRLGLWLLARRKRLAPLAGLLGPLAGLGDTLLARLPIGPYRSSTPDAEGEELDCNAFMACLCEMLPPRQLRPQYDSRSFGWLVERAARMRTQGELHKIAVKAGGNLVGCYLYYSKPGGLSQVLQIAARDGHADRVLNHLAHHAYEHGAIAICGRLEPSFIQALCQHHCLFDAYPLWVLTHSRHPNLLAAFEQGTARLSRLDGEWCQHFQ